jgi:predicted anti-sigma-YlaC factor YlaD
MKQTFSRQQWVEYTSGVAPVELTFEIDRHIGRCEECAQISRQFAEVDRELIAAVAALRDSIPVSEWSAERAYETWRRQRPSVAEADRVSNRIVRLQLFLAPICGFGTAQRAMLAAGESAAAPVDLLTELEWPAFLQHLSSIVGALCGEPAGRLLWYLGQPIPSAL